MTPTKTRTRKPAPIRREEIVRAVLRIIGDRGVAAVTASALAQEVGLTSGALFRHFDSMDDILRATVRIAVARLEETFPDPGLPPRQRLLTLARARVKLLRGDPGLGWMLRSEQAYVVLPEDAVEQLREVVARSRGELLNTLRDGMRDGSFRDDIAARDLLVPVMGTIHALTGGAGVHREATAANRRHAERALAALMRMLAPPDPKQERRKT